MITCYKERLNSINVISFVTAGLVAFDIIELNVIIKISFYKGSFYADLDGVGELSIRLEVPCFIGRVLLNHVCLGILIVSETHQDDVRIVDPDLTNYLTMRNKTISNMSQSHLLAKFSTDVTETLDSIEAHGFQPTIAQHLGDLIRNIISLFNHQFIDHLT